MAPRRWRKGDRVKCVDRHAHPQAPHETERIYGSVGTVNGFAPHSGRVVVEFTRRGEGILALLDKSSLRWIRRPTPPLAAVEVLPPHKWEGDAWRS